MPRSARLAAYEGYAALAPFYDEFVAHPAYRRWILSIEQMARGLGVDGLRLLDVGCGTGRSFAVLLERGYLVTAVEPVGPMLAQARRRSPRRVRTAHALTVDAPAGPFDLVLALNDVVNCVPDAEELHRTLVAVAARLADRGVFAFDVTPRVQHAVLFGRRTERVTARARFSWSPGATSDADERLAHLHIWPTGQPETVAVHRQRTIDPHQVRAALAAAGLHAVAMRGCDNDGRLLPTTTGAFKHIYFASHIDPRRRKEVRDAQGAQAASQGRRHAGDRQAGLSARWGAARGAAPTPHGGEGCDGR